MDWKDRLQFVTAFLLIAALLCHICGLYFKVAGIEKRLVELERNLPAESPK